jgi:hypothetical protein
MLAYVANQHPYHPVRDWLNHLVWDGVGRSAGFRVADDAWDVPFRTVLGGLLNQRCGQELPSTLTDWPRPACHLAPVESTTADYRLVGEDGLLEIKCPSAPNHVLYMLEGVGAKYRPQVHGQLWITGRKWADKVSYHPVIPAVVVRVERDEKIIAAIAREVGAFCDRLDELKKQYDPQRLAALNGEVPSAFNELSHPF